MNSSLLLALNFGYMDIGKVKVGNKSNLQYVNNKKLNCLDMSIISGYYSISHYFIAKE